MMPTATIALSRASNRSTLKVPVKAPAAEVTGSCNEPPFPCLSDWAASPAVAKSSTAIGTDTLKLSCLVMVLPPRHRAADVPCRAPWVGGARRFEYETCSSRVIRGDFPNGGARVIAAYLVLLIGQEAAARGDLKQLARYSQRMEVVVRLGAENWLTEPALRALRRWPV